ncbi:Beta-methylmalyl-CoA dehydratase [Rhodovastum atsumiense]|uniref:MaoC family dehydratase n=1 Tax=Rhodovastum atsumiense TaxID=504468 RepID=A0A5M6ILW8_9PROT|nr:MaoC family dehydratase [Rhodovastum atsumiense]KAA5609283.1 MaoC family dehydratase [Rhodovastum atsumiense]CAH2604582.1 Beta-methylmalyl-CoA dehydratase [Rhodovastum atsumiense]
MSGSKTTDGAFFEDFRLGQTIVHATPRTVTEGDVALHTALYGSRFAVQSSRTLAAAIGLPGAPLDDWLVFHIVFGKTVPDISRNAVANLGYADGRFGRPVYPGDTLRAVSEVIGLRESAKGDAGVVHVRSVGINQYDEEVLSYVRWVLVRKRVLDAPPPAPVAPELPAHVPVDALVVPDGVDLRGYDTTLSGSTALWDDYDVGERIDHVDGVTIEEADHMLATRLWQNTARVHFDLHAARGGRFGRRLVYGGHVISLARALSFNGLANAFKVAALNAGRHVAPVFAGDTIYAWSEVVARDALPGRADLGALRLRTVAAKDHPCGDFPDRDAKGAPHPAVVLDLDTTVLMPRRI